MIWFYNGKSVDPFVWRVLVTLERWVFGLMVIPPWDEVAVSSYGFAIGYEKAEDRWHASVRLGTRHYGLQHRIRWKRG